ncbi:MAG: polyprenyl diphosphate synthase [Alphaproteobacteria bacterium]|nr:polyprenyl diphosphate synthase [Alphaproteobacteria bacterium]
MQKHIAFIMDGNRRWAKKNNLSLLKGYREGFLNIQTVLLELLKYDISKASFFAFSTENWKRDVKELNILEDVFEKMFAELTNFASEHGVRIRVIGDISGFREGVRRKVTEIENNTKDNTNISIQVAAGYGGRMDIVEAARGWARSGGDPEKLTESVLQTFMQADFLGDVDILVRTGGAQRISNFLLWHCAYADYFFPTAHWPDFGAEDLKKILDSYNNIKRNYGA